jgi:hypothetical protein
MDIITKLIIGSTIGATLLVCMSILLTCAYELSSKPVVYVHDKIVKGINYIRKD